VLASILAGGVTAHAETDVFMLTVAFAHTGGDDAADSLPHTTTHASDAFSVAAAATDIFDTC
jgi:hypothetical protein